MRILLIGGSGQVGWELQRTLAPLGPVTVAGRRSGDARVDVGDPRSIRALVRETRPTVIVNAAAYTAVDRSEEEPHLATAVNAVAPAVLAETAKAVGARLVHFSTDYVFDGTAGEPYTETSRPSPLNVYGKTKLAGDRAIIESGVAHLIFRTSWVYGLRGRNFLLTMLRKRREGRPIAVVADQFGCPTWSRLIAEVTTHALVRFDRNPYLGGLYNLAGGGTTSWHGFAERVFRLLPDGSNTVVKAVGSDEFPSRVYRPAWSVLSTEKLRRTFDLDLPDWGESLQRCLAGASPESR